MGIKIAITNQKIVAQRSDMLRAMMIYNCPTQHDICFSNDTMNLLLSLCQDGSKTIKDMEMYVTSFIHALDLCDKDGDIGKMMDSFVVTTLAIYFCCNEQVIDSCLSCLCKDSSQIHKRIIIYEISAQNNIDQILDLMCKYRSKISKTVKTITNHYVKQTRQIIPGWEKRTLGPVLRHGDDLIL